MALNNLLFEITCTSISHWVLENLLHTATIKSAQAFCFYGRQYDFEGSTYTVQDNDQFLVRGLEKKDYSFTFIAYRQRKALVMICQMHY